MFMVPRLRSTLGCLNPRSLMRYSTINNSYFPGIPSNLLELRVGYIMNCQNHPEADSLYVSKVIVDPEEYKKYKLMVDGPAEDKAPEEIKSLTICSGLRNLVPRTVLQDSFVVIVNNLKPSKMRGIKSEGMVLAAEKILAKEDPSTETPPSRIIELVRPPHNSEPNDLLQFKSSKFSSNDIPANELLAYKELSNMRFSRIRNSRKLINCVEGLTIDGNLNITWSGVNENGEDLEKCVLVNPSLVAKSEGKQSGEVTVENEKLVGAVVR